MVDPVEQLVVEPWQTGTLTVEGPAPGSPLIGTLGIHVLNSANQPNAVFLRLPQ